MEEPTRKHSLKVSFIDGCFASIMIGFTANYATPFALVLGAKNFHIGLLNAIPQLSSAFGQLPAGDLAERVRSRVRFITYGVMGQALLWLVIGSIPYLIKENQTSWFIILLTLTTISGAIVGPAWSSLMSDTVDKTQYGTYFAWRGRIHGFIALISNLIAGVWLYKMAEDKYLAFAILFCFAGLCRIASGVFLNKMTDVPLEIPLDKRFNYLDFIRRLPESNFAKFTLFVAFLNLAVFIAAPFFAVYMLRNLGFSYTEYALVNTAGALASLLSLPLWGKIADRYGNVKILRATALFTPLLTLSWIVTDNLPYLIITNAFAGYIWAGFNLCAVNFIFDAASPPVRTRCLGYFNFTNGIAIFIGSITGGYMVNYLPPLRLLLGQHIIISNLLTLFFISGFLRMVIVLIGLNSFKEVRTADTIEEHKLLSIILGFKPMIDLGQNIFFRTHNPKQDRSAEL